MSLTPAEVSLLERLLQAPLIVGDTTPDDDADAIVSMARAGYIHPTPTGWATTREGRIALGIHALASAVARVSVPRVINTASTHALADAWSAVYSAGYEVDGTATLGDVLRAHLPHRKPSLLQRVWDYLRS